MKPRNSETHEHETTTHEHETTQGSDKQETIRKQKTRDTNIIDENKSQ